MSMVENRDDLIVDNLLMTFYRFGIGTPIYTYGWGYTENFN